MAGKYINPYTDYGFKRLFGIEENKDLLISFLNSLISDRTDIITDLTYKNIEQIGRAVKPRASYFDVYCETSQGRRFIVEMQNSWEQFFKDRTLYYAAKAIRDQGVKGDPTKRELVNKKSKPRKWNYRLNEVYLIAVMNFNFPGKEYKPDEYYHRVMLTDLDDHHVFYEKLTLIYLEMPKVGKVQLDMGRPLDRWLRALYLLWADEDCPSELEDPVFQKFYEQAEFARFTPDQQLTYERSMKRELDIYNQIEGGRILGREEGREEGRKEAILEMVQKLKDEGMDDETISRITGH